MKTQSSFSSNLIILTIVTFASSIFTCVSSAGYNLIVINGLSDNNPLKVDCPPNPVRDIGKGARHAWHFDQPPQGLECFFTWNHQKTKIKNIFANNDVYFLARNEAIFKADKDIPFKNPNIGWNARAAWHDEADFDTPSCELSGSCE